MNIKKMKIDFGEIWLDTREQCFYCENEISDDQEEEIYNKLNEIFADWILKLDDAIKKEFSNSTVTIEMRS